MKQEAGSFASQEKGAGWRVAKILSSCTKWEQGDQGDRLALGVRPSPAH